MRFSGKFIASAAVAAGMIAAPTAAANAASVSAWDQVAACESGGNWQTNTGNGYYGGLQFSQQTWSGHGGDQYAPTADQATKERRLRLVSVCLPPRVLAHGRTAVVRWVNPPHHQRPDLARPRMTATTSCSGHGVLSSSE